MQAANHRKEVGFNITGLHHFAWRCRDAEETRALYEDVLGLPLVHVILNRRVPSTQEPMPHLHIFFQMGDGSYLAFFDLGDETAALPSPNTPSWVNHIAIQVADNDELMAAKTRLEENGYDVLGVVDHRIIDSIYFFDPNGLRVEITTKTLEDAEFEKAARDAHGKLAEWTQEKSSSA
jgi:catechol 2,3-dioxygenase-like lactoylglutathione lyase family enzyme